MPPNTGTTPFIGIVWLLNRTNPPELWKMPLSEDGEAFRNFWMTSAVRLWPILDQVGLGWPNRAMMLLLSTHRTQETLWQTTTNLCWLWIFGNTPTILTTETQEPSMSKTSQSPLTGNSLKETFLPKRSPLSCDFVWMNISLFISEVSIFLYSTHNLYFLPLALGKGALPYISINL